VGLVWRRKESAGPSQEANPAHEFLIPMASGLSVFIVATLTLALALAPTTAPETKSAATSESERVTQLIAELKADRLALADRLDRMQKDAGLTTGSIDAAVSVVPEARKSTVVETTFGADVGRGTTIKALRQQWFELLSRDRSLASNEARVSIRETADGQVLTLIVGPFTNAADAASLCARLSSIAPGCIPTLFEGQRLPGGSASGL
jgi:hypothetical protein